MFKDIPDLIAAITDEIVLRIDRDRFVLGFPWQSGITSFSDQSGGPFGVFSRIIIFAPIGLVDGVQSLLFSGDRRAPKCDVGRPSGSIRNLQCAKSCRVLLIGWHAVAGGVNDGGTLAATGLEQFVHAGQEFGHASNGVQAVMSVPDIAEDDGCFARQPFFGAFLTLPRAILA